MTSCNQTVTIYNRYTENRQECWKRTVLNGVSWFGKQRVYVSAEGCSSADMGVIRIPESSMYGYASPAKWLTGQVGWTLRDGDVLVKGTLDVEVSPGESITKVLTSAEQSITVQSIGDNRRGGLPHIRVSGGVQNANGN